MSQSTGKREPIYEQVLDYARREIDDATSKIDELKQSLSLLEARVEAAKSVYEAVAARLNLEDEGNLPEAVYTDVPPRLEPESDDSEEAADAGPVQAEAPQAAAPPSPAPAPEPEPAEPESAPSASAAHGSSENGNSENGNNVSMELIRRHLEERARRAESELQVTAPPPVAAPAPEPAPAPVSAPAPGHAPAPEVEDSSPATAETQDAEPDEDGTVGFPGLSEADRRLIEEHMRRRAEASRNR